MRILFLDVDGILNRHIAYPQNGYCGIEPECLAQFNRIIEAVPDLGVVLSSAWRYQVLGRATTLLGFNYLLLTHGVDKRLQLVGCTPSDEDIRGRGRQIEAWLQEYSSFYDVTQYAILDDETAHDFTPLWTHLIRCNGSEGLTCERANLTINKLRGQ